MINVYKILRSFDNVINCVILNDDIADIEMLLVDSTTHVSDILYTVLMETLQKANANDIHELLVLEYIGVVYESMDMILGTVHSLQLCRNIIFDYDIFDIKYKYISTHRNHSMIKFV